MNRFSKRILFCFAVIAFALPLTAGTQPAQAEDKSSRPNIIFIFADDWGWGDLSCHGSETFKTPHLDKLASQGTDFQRFTVASGVCSPSRTAVMTGQYPARFSIHQHFATVQHNKQCGMPDWLPTDTVLLPRLLKEAGYATAHFGKWHLTNTHVPDAPEPVAYGYDETAVFNGPGPQVNANPNTDKPTPTDKAIDFMRRHKGQPFFINLWVHATHTPHYPTERWMNEFKNLNERQRVYAAVVADADERIGQVLTALDDLKLADNTLVIFSSDNGPERTGSGKRTDDNSTGPGLGTFFSVGTTGGLRGQKRSLYQGGVGVPFLVRWPGNTPSAKVDKSSVVTAVDLLPTFCAAAGVALPEGYESDGQNVLPALRGEKITRDKPIFWEWQGSAQGNNWPRLGAVVDRWALLTNFDHGKLELYDLADDRGQNTNVAEENPEVTDRLLKQLQAWKQSLPKDPPEGCFSKARK